MPGGYARPPRQEREPRLRCLVHGGHRQIGSFDLPDLHGIKPVIWRQARFKGVVGAGLIDHMILEELLSEFKFKTLHYSLKLKLTQPC